MGTISLNEFIKDERYNYLKDLNIDILKVNLIKEEMNINIVLNSDRFINKNTFQDLGRLFGEKLEDFSIVLDINYDIDHEKIKDNQGYIEEIRNIISKTVPSSSSWIKDLNYKIEEDSF